MDTRLFFENFSALADSPNGVQNLRELILQLAMMGKLVPQDPGDTCGEELLKEIDSEGKNLPQEAHKKRIKEIKSNGNKGSLFNIPDIWTWSKIGRISYDWGQKKPKDKFSYIDVSSIENGNISKNVQILEAHNAPSRARKLVRPGSVIYATIRPYLLNIAVIDREYNPSPIVSTAFAVVHPYSSINGKFLYYYFQSEFFINYIESLMTGVAYPAVNEGKFFNSPVPIPPLSEQHRIVTKVGELIALCDELEEKKKKRDECRITLGKSALGKLSSSSDSKEFKKHWQRICDHFELIFDAPENAKELRQAILVLAFQGKLANRDPNTESVEKLLSVDNQKAKKQGRTTRGNEKNEILLDLPKEWRLCFLHEVAEVEMGNSPPGDTYNDNGEGVPLINGPVEFSPGPFGKTKKIKFTTKPTKMCKSNDLLICVRGSTTGRTNIASFDACVGRGVAYIRAKIYQPYLNYYICSLYQAILGMGVGTAFPSISQEQIRNIPFPLPSLREQSSIVKKINELMTLCDGLEEALKQSKTISENLMESVVHHLVEA
jgi:type I restriction enzyme, S subunit